MSKHCRCFNGHNRLGGMIRPTHPALTQQCLRKFSHFSFTFCIRHKKTWSLECSWKWSKEFGGALNLLQITHIIYVQTFGCKLSKEIMRKLENKVFAIIFIVCICVYISTKYSSPGTSDHCFQRSLCFFFFSFLSFHITHGLR